jgi:N-acetylneuraminate synthase
VPISLDPAGLRDLVHGSRAVHAALGGRKTILAEEQPTIDFAYACVVTTRAIRAGEALTADAIWVKRPGTGEILAKDYDHVLGRTARHDLPADHQVAWADLAEQT